MTCLIVVPSLIRAGAETQAVELANGLANRGHTVHLCSFESQLDLRARLSDRVVFHHKRRRRKYDVPLTRKLAQLIDQERIEVVLGVLQFATLMAWLASLRSDTRPPVVAGVHTTINRGPKQDLQDRVVYRYMLRRLSSTVFVCNHQRDHWLSKYPELESRSSVVHNGVESDRFERKHFAAQSRQLRESLAIPKEHFLLACIAAFRPEKGHRLVLEAFSKVKGNAELVLAGDGSLRSDMEALARLLGIQERVRFMGTISDTRPLIGAANATVLASTAVETFSMAMLESMAMGTPMIAPQIGGLPEAITHDGTGLLFPIGDVSALQRSIQYCVDQPLEVARMGQEAMRTVRERFTLQNMVTGTEQILLRSLNGRA